MPDTRTLSLTLSTPDAAAISAMAAALALPVDDFLSGVVTAWAAKPKNYRRFAKRLLGDDEGDDRRKRVKAVARSLKRKQREAPAKPAVKDRAKAKPKAKASRTRKLPAGVEAKRSEAPQLALAAPA